MSTNLPEKFQEFAESRRNGFLKVKELKDKGEKICGAFCQYTPSEIIMAAGMYQVALCGRSSEPIPAAETKLPSNLCPLIKASYGHALEESCPYAFFSDIVVGETTCDGKKKMYELLSEIKPMQVIHLPNIPDYDRSLSMWTEELHEFRRGLEEKLGSEITDKKLNEAIKWMNKERIQNASVYELGKTDPPSIKGTEMRHIMDSLTYNFDRNERYLTTQSVLDELKNKWNEGTKEDSSKSYSPRVIVSGAGLGGTEEKILNVFEELGGNIVCYEGCCGISSMRRLVDEDETRDPIERIAEKYLEVPCAVVSPNNRRMEQVRETIKEWNADGILSVTLHSCNPFAIETENIRKVCKECGIPLLHIETDFSQNDSGQIRTRLEAFIELMRENKGARNE